MSAFFVYKPIHQKDESYLEDEALSIQENQATMSLAGKPNC